MRKIRNDTPEKAAARLERFLAAPPKRISEQTTARRRNRAIRRAAHRSDREELATLQGWKCTYCGRHMRKKEDRRLPHLTATIDHRTPISRGGTNAKGNLVAACKGCNQDKGSMTEDEYRTHLANKKKPRSDCAAGAAAGITRNIVTGDYTENPAEASASLTPC